MDKGMMGAINGIRSFLDDLEEQVDEVMELYEEDQKTKDAAYQEGLDDAWEAARGIAVYPIAGGLKTEELREIFETDSVDQIFRENLANDAMQKIKAYKERNKLCVGDEIVTSHPKDGHDFYGIVVEAGEATAKVLLEDYTFWFPNYANSTYRKTGRHVDVDMLWGSEEKG